MGYLKINVDMSKWGISAKLASAAKRAEHAVAVQMAKDMEPYTPASGEPAGFSKRTQVKDNLIIYPGPYARYLYYGKVMVDAATGRGPAHFIDKHGNEVIKFPKGSKLRATDRDLVFSKAHHPNPQAFWDKAAKAENLDKWKRVAAKAVTRFDK